MGSRSGRGSQRTSVVVLSVIASVVVTLGCAAVGLFLWAFDPCGGGGIAADCTRDGSSHSSTAITIAFFATLLSWAATACVIRFRRDAAVSTALLVGVGVGGPAVVAASAAALLSTFF